jgi:hypothetical protein
MGQRPGQWDLPVIQISYTLAQILLWERFIPFLRKQQFRKENLSSKNSGARGLFNACLDMY